MSIDCCCLRSSTPVEWAQRKTSIYVHIRVDDLKDAKVIIEKDKVVFSGKGGTDGKLHNLTLDLFGEVKTDDSKYFVRGRGVEVVLMKADTDGQYWKRLLKDDKKHHWLRVDFDKWQDEDESDDEAGGVPGMGGGNFEEMMRQMGGLGGGFGAEGGLGDGFGEDDPDSDDDDLPELEENTPAKNGTEEASK